VQRRASSIIYVVERHTFYPDEVKEWGRLVALRRDVQYVGSIDISEVYIGSHLITYQSDQLIIAVICGEVQCSELLVRYLIRPDLQRFSHGFFIFV